MLKIFISRRKSANIQCHLMKPSIDELVKVLHAWSPIKQIKDSGFKTSTNVEASPDFFAVIININLVLPAVDIKFAVVNMLNHAVGIYNQVYVSQIQSGGQIISYDEDIKPLESLEDIVREIPIGGSLLQAVTHEMLLKIIVTEKERLKLKEILNKCKLNPADNSPSNLAKALRRIAHAWGPEELKLIRKFNVDINAQDDSPEKRKTAMHWAIEAEKIENIKMLAKFGGRIDIKNAAKKSALDLISESKNIEIKNLVLMSFEDFKKILFFKHQMGQEIPANYVEDLYTALNFLALQNESKRWKINFAIKQGLKFVFAFSDPKRTAAGEFVSFSNEIYVYVNNLNFVSYERFCLIMAHELEHANKCAVNSSCHNVTPFTHPFSVTLPFFPDEPNELLRFAAYIKAGDVLVCRDFFVMLLRKAASLALSSDELIRLEGYINSLMSFCPPVKEYTLKTADFCRLAGINSLSDLNQTQVYKIEFNQEGFKMPFWVHHIQISPDSNRVLVEGYHAKNIHDFSEAVLAFIYETMQGAGNRHLGSLNQDPTTAVAELHANMAGILPDDVLQRFYNELMKYDQHFAVKAGQFIASNENNSEVLDNNTVTSFSKLSLGPKS